MNWMCLKIERCSWYCSSYEVILTNMFQIITMYVLRRNAYRMWHYRTLQIEMQHLRITLFRRFVVKGKEYPEDETSWEKECDSRRDFKTKRIRSVAYELVVPQDWKTFIMFFIMWPSYCDNVFQILTPRRTRRNRQQLLLLKERSSLQSVKLRDLVNWNATSERVDILRKICSQGERLSWGWNLVGEWNMFLDSIPLPKESGQLLINWICHKIGRHS